MSAGSRNGSVRHADLDTTHERRICAPLNEYVHTQQDYLSLGTVNGGPQFLRGSLLRHSIMEGSADLLTELVTGPTISATGWAT